MTKKQLAIKLVELVFSFEEEKDDTKEYTLHDFADYITSLDQPAKLDMRVIHGEQEQWIQDEHATQRSDISILLVLLYRYAKGYIKKALKNSVVQTPDEFSFLITLMTFNSLTKTELINKQVMEITSGTEVIKRLIKSDLIQPFKDSDDKRSVRVSVTDKGKSEIAKILPDMGIVSQIIVGSLTQTEVLQLQFLLAKLDHHHHELYHNTRHSSLNDILG